MNKSEKETNIMREIYNSAWEKNWGFVPMTKEEANLLAQKLKPLADPTIVYFAEIDGKPVAFSASIPDYNQVLRHLNGKLGPIEIIRFLWYKNRINMSRVMGLGVKKKYRNLGIELLFFYKTMERIRKLGRPGYRVAIGEDKG